MIKMITLATIKTRSTRNGFIPSHLLRLGVNQTKAELRTSHIPPLCDVLDVGMLEMFRLGFLVRSYASKRKELPSGCVPGGFSLAWQNKSRFCPAEPAFQAAQALRPRALTSVDNSHLPT